MSHENIFRRFIDAERGQLELNRKNGYLPYGTTVYHAQQYVEKTIKGALTECGEIPDRGHWIPTYLDKLAMKVPGMREDPLFRDMRGLCWELSEEYNRCRYPDMDREGGGEYDPKDVKRYVDMACSIVSWVGKFELPCDEPVSNSVRIGFRRRSRIIADTPAYRRTVSEYSGLLRA